MIIFTLREPYIELHKLLKITGISPTGGEAKQAIAAGLVKVDGAVETRKANKIREGQRVEFQGDVIEVRKAESGGASPLICS